MNHHIYAARCILAALGIENPSDEAMVGGSLLAEACHNIGEIATFVRSIKRS